MDLMNLSSDPRNNVSVFMGSAITSFINWQTWRKPRGANFVYIIGVSGGAGGGAGVNTSTTSGGGGGGAGGGLVFGLLPSLLLPDVLFVAAGTGGIGGKTSGANGANGVSSMVSTEPSTATSQGMLFSTGTPLAGSAATASAGGAAGAGGSFSLQPLVSTMFRGVNGQSGTAGGAPTAAGTALVLPTTGLITTGGTGGGGSNGATCFDGGQIPGAGLGSEFLPTVLGGIAASGATAAIPGLTTTVSRMFGILQFGGTGGGGANNTAGGNASSGGRGSPGCGGGGGGGANTTNTTVGAGGDGGPGFVIIICG